MKRLGLRSEIVLQLGLLMAAALLLSSVLILKFYEQEMLQQQVDSAISQLRLLSLSVKSGTAAELALELQQSSSQSPLQALYAQIDNQSAFTLFASFKDENINTENLRKVGITGQVLFDLGTSGQFFGWEIPESLQVTVPLNSRHPYRGALQGQFSLQNLAAKIATLHEVILIIVLLFGLILTLFGSYLLGKNVVKPILALEMASQRVANGDLEPQLKISGSRTLTNLATSFNSMTIALRSAQTNRENHINELEQLNHQLQKTRNDLVQAEKMSSLGHLAAGMAHEIGNPLGALIGYLELLKKSTDEGGQGISSLALTEAGRIDQLVRDLLDYARPVNDRDSISDIRSEIVTSCRILVQQNVCTEERLKLQTDSSLPEVRIAPNRLHQVMINLLRNALDAATPGSSIEINAYHDDGQVRISVSNQGTPIDDNKIASLFDPFFTTKSPDKGRGLGLFVCHNIIHDAGGSISASSKNGRNTFVIKLPVAGEDDAQA